ncbi:MAG: hypothetical protein P0116_17125 [Candidatus Nitrosocosmicus sp.]|nr:hypothetical protein [Candidatus Nitrosocosmicus sp.]
MSNGKKILSEILASAALILLVTYILDANISMSNNVEEGFLPLSAEELGMIFWTGSIILFLISFIIGLKVSSKVLTGMLLIGGGILGTTMLFSFIITQAEHNAIVTASSQPEQIVQPRVFGMIATGYLIMGFGILRIIRKR